MEIYSSISPWVKICQGVARCGELPVERTCAVDFTCGNMASKKKKRKLSRAELKKIPSRKGKSSAEKRGKGAGSRKKFTLPAKWREQHDEKNGKMQLKFVSPGKTVYRAEKSVAKTLTATNLESCFHEALASSEETEDSEDTEYLPDIKDSPPDEPGCSGKKRKWSNKEENNSPSQAARKKAKLEVEHRLFVCETTQLTDFVDKINETSCCSTPDCDGMYRSVDYFLSVFFKASICLLRSSYSLFSVDMHFLTLFL